MFDLRLGDCLEVMRSMPSGSVDSIVTDPPYGMSFQSQWVPTERRKAKIAGDGNPFIWWLAEAHRVLRDGGGDGLLYRLAQSRDLADRHRMRRL